MQNLEQVRARNALMFAQQYGEKIRGDQGGEVIKKLAPHLINHGLLATLAYAFGEKEGWRLTFDAIARHLADSAIKVAPPDKVKDTRNLIDWLTDANTSSGALKEATAEAMAWLQYARRFVQKPEKK